MSQVLKVAVTKTQNGGRRCWQGCKKTHEAQPAPFPVRDNSYLGIRAYGLAAFHAGVGAELVEAFQAAVMAVLLHILLPLQGVPTVVTVELLGHGAHLIAGGTWRGKQGEQMSEGKYRGALSQKAPEVPTHLLPWS